jgi:hypothetical protein
MNPDGPEAGIAEKDFQAGARGRVALQHGVDVIADAGKERHKGSGCVLFELYGLQRLRKKFVRARNSFALKGRGFSRAVREPNEGRL